MHERLDMVLNANFLQPLTIIFESLIGYMAEKGRAYKTAKQNKLGTSR